MEYFDIAKQITRDHMEKVSKRHTTAHERYHIADPVCGLIETASSLAKALDRAKAHSCEGVTIFDSMARFECAPLWNVGGEILEFRQREQPCKS